MTNKDSDKFFSRESSNWYKVVYFYKTTDNNKQMFVFCILLFTDRQ
jgi:hypothetical protein